MRPLKCFAWKPWCWWNGHVPVDGMRWSVVYGERVPCVCCKHCHKVL